MSAAIDSNPSQGNDVNQQFTELLGLCRSDLGEILEKLRQKYQVDA